MDCPVCEGEGVVAVNFGINSPGRPELRDCFHCAATGQVLPETLVAIGEAVMRAEVLPDGQVKIGHASTSEARMMLMLLRGMPLAYTPETLTDSPEDARVHQQP